MNAKYSRIINCLIILLIIILVYVMFNYYTSDKKLVSNPSSEISMNNNQPKEVSATPTKKENEISVISGEISKNEENEGKDSGEKIEFSEYVVLDSKQEEHMEPTAQSTETISIESVPAQVSSNESSQASSPVIITSENDISSKEKREILGELDKTLMELLDVVDKVQIVDESRLPSDSEVGL